MYPIENARKSTFSYGTIVASKLIEVEYDNYNRFISADHAYLVYRGNESEVIIEDRKENTTYIVYTGTWEKAQLYFDNQL